MLTSLVTFLKRLVAFLKRLVTEQPAEKRCRKALQVHFNVLACVISCFDVLVLIYYFLVPRLPRLPPHLLADGADGAPKNNI